MKGFSRCTVFAKDPCVPVIGWPGCVERLTSSLLICGTAAACLQARFGGDTVSPQLFPIEEEDQCHRKQKLQVDGAEAALFETHLQVGR